jgi:hypothetical protein
MKKFWLAFVWLASIGLFALGTTRPSAAMFILPMVSQMTAKASCPT